jgi:hypothetical protein
VLISAPLKNMSRRISRPIISVIVAGLFSVRALWAANVRDETAEPKLSTQFIEKLEAAKTDAERDEIAARRDPASLFSNDSPGLHARIVESV